MQLINKEDYGSVFSFTNEMLPEGILVHLWITVRVTCPAPPLGDCYLFADVWPHPNILCAVDHLHPTPGQVTSVWPCFWSRLDEDAVSKFLQELNETMNLAKFPGLLFCGIPDYQTHSVEKIFGEERGGKYQEYLNYQFWMTPEKQKVLMQTEINPPVGYYFDKLKMDEAKFVDDTWPHQFPGSLMRIKHRIENFPNVALRVNGTGELASFEILHDQHGFMNHLYTLENHRRKGLATKVEEKLAQIIIAQGYVPFKFVVKSNIGGKSMTDVSPWWTDLGYLGIYISCVKEVVDEK